MTRRSLRAESGFTLVELMIAMLLLVIGIMATASTIDGSRGVTNTAEREQAAINVAEQELEQMRALTYDALAIRDTSFAKSADSRNPDFFLSAGGCGTNFATPCFLQYDFSGSSSSTEQLVRNANGKVDHITNWRDDRNRIRGQIYRYVTFVDDTCALCTPAQDYKRIQVAVTTTRAGTTTDYLPPRRVVLSSFRINPASAIAGASGENPCGNAPNAAQDPNINCHDAD